MNTNNSGLTESTNIVSDNKMPVVKATAPRPKMSPSWDHPSRWKGVRIDQCSGCKRLGKDVLRNGLCWLCDSLRMSEEARIKFSKP